MEALHRRLDEARQQGNQAYKAGEDAQALKLYSGGIDDARQAGACDLDGFSHKNAATQKVRALLSTACVFALMRNWNRASTLAQAGASVAWRLGDCQSTTAVFSSAVCWLQSCPIVASRPSQHPRR